MAKTAFVFAGQGAQYPGMGKEIYNNNSVAKNIFDLAEKIRPGTMAQCFDGRSQDLTITLNAQPCLFCVDLAIASALKDSGIVPDMVAGFSLGEIPALTFSGVFSNEQGFDFVNKRAEFMHAATQEVESSMVAVLKLDVDRIKSLAQNYSEIYPVNFNCPGQTVVAGKTSELEKFSTNVKEAGGKVIPLAVSGGFHSPFMNGAAKNLSDELSKIDILIPAYTTYSNFTAEPYPNDISEIKKQISSQVNNPVMWQRTIENMILAGVETFIEVGPGKTLSGLIKKINQDVIVKNVDTYSDFVEVISQK
jgi:[acyl-carrier-protein] S-malonyltransferase